LNIILIVPGRSILKIFPPYLLGFPPLRRHYWRYLAAAAAVLGRSSAPISKRCTLRFFLRRNQGRCGSSIFHLDVLGVLRVCPRRGCSASGIFETAWRLASLLPPCGFPTHGGRLFVGCGNLFWRVCRLVPRRSGCRRLTSHRLKPRNRLSPEWD